MHVKNVVESLAHYPREVPLPAPAYIPPEDTRSRAALAVPSMAMHMSDEGWQLMLALQAGGYTLHGRGLGLGTSVPVILMHDHPSIVMVQDQHEWDTGHLAKREEYFHGYETLKDRPDVFKLTVVKDTHRQYESAKRNSEVIGCHAWIVYYNMDIVLRTLNWLRPEHTIRTYHTVDKDIVPAYNAVGRRPCLLSGSMGAAYPLRIRIRDSHLRGIDYVAHPGYSNKGTSTPSYLKRLSTYKVAICTASKFGYALRKLFEATACGCRVITDLPVDEVLPGIDGNLVRVEPNIPAAELQGLVHRLVGGYDPAFQEHMAAVAKSMYDYRVEGARLANEIERVRNNYR